MGERWVGWDLVVLKSARRMNVFAWQIKVCKLMRGGGGKYSFSNEFRDLL